MEHNFLVHSSGKFWEQRNIWKGSPVFLDGMLQMEIHVPFPQSYLWDQFKAFEAILR